ncbi:high-affinity branched-chain amino acid transport system permease protein LivH [Variibacter gotjawalensis]|uniref:High-affinity branched-chain amino acid transport system permease protein LivH n=1 Tax=Variibacter gotjawalensis TaxID=1333996 RepID=A0A0S3PWB7_9BRAD|nr:branched-chain amino acid ABC transporter permease [Variibacter gotjawalensis]NIK46016.1 branched-chain amino acid transport system permease protein [Variibacter gotjawalensis]RZS47934.1 amino acid/amide ABC transporter membrane protein 1 (HAAT family) [Variibacter gotjawalensis]BAT60190.1 high-affinity branched-chain amino acid transport system permease protein LivH [Variibacter gotjawalensis]
METFVFSTLNGTLYGLLLFMLSSGLTLIFSMMGVLNFAHASFYMLGAYFAYAIGARTGFWGAMFLAPILVGAIGALVERFGLRNVHKHGHVAELLFTFGIAFLIEEIVKLIWGRNPVPYSPPAILQQPLFTLWGTQYPAFRVFMMVVAVLMFIALFLLLKRTRVGLIVQAALTFPHMVGHLGHNVPLVFMGVFAVGCAMAGLAGVIGGALLVTEPAMALTLGPIVFVVVVVGGMGSLGGAFVAAMLIGLVQTFAVAVDASLADLLARFGIAVSNRSDLGRITLAQVAPMLPFLLLVLVLIFRPRGLMGARES